MYYDIFILGSLIKEPHYGYEIKKLLIEQFSFCTNISNNSLYPILRKFEAKALTEKQQIATGGKPDRIVYNITPKGRQEFVQMLRHFPSSVFQNQEDFFLRLFFFHWMDKPARKRLLDGREKHIRKFYETFESNAQSATNQIIADYGLHQVKSELDVIDKYRALIDAPCMMNEDGEIV